MNVASSIEIFILTWNRRAFLEKALGSVLSQTVRPARVVVVDNASDDGTAEYVESVAAANPHVELARQPVHVDVCANMTTAVEGARAEYFLLMHDDDLLDPGFVSWVGALLAKEADVSMVCSAQKSFMDGDACDDARLDGLGYEVYPSRADFIAADFARRLIRQCDSVCFPATVYRRSCARVDVLKGNVFGKIVDKPFLFDCMGSGKVVRLSTPLYKYRVHVGQDSSGSANGPYPGEILNMLDAERRALEPNAFYSKCFKALSVRSMKSLYKWGGNPRSGWRKFFKEARDRGLTASAFSRPWRLPFWRNWSDLSCRRLLAVACKTAATRIVLKKEVEP